MRLIGFIEYARHGRNITGKVPNTSSESYHCIFSFLRRVCLNTHRSHAARTDLAGSKIRVHQGDQSLRAVFQKLLHYSQQVSRNKRKPGRSAPASNCYCSIRELFLTLKSSAASMISGLSEYLAIEITHSNNSSEIISDNSSSLLYSQSS